jgi:hypothetical protein
MVKMLPNPFSTFLEIPLNKSDLDIEIQSNSSNSKLITIVGEAKNNYIKDVVTSRGKDCVKLEIYTTMVPFFSSKEDSDLKIDGNKFEIDLDLEKLETSRVCIGNSDYAVYKAI